MKEQKTNRSANVVGTSIVCVILTFLLTLLLFASVAVQQHVMQNELPKAASAIQLDKMDVRNTSGEWMKLPKLILDEYIQDNTITEEQMGNVLHEGTFRYLLGDKVYEYNAWLASGGEGTFPEVTVDECITALKNNYGLMYRETGFRMRSEDEIRFRSDLEAPLSDLNAKLSGTLEKGIIAFILKACIAGWFWMIPAVLLLVLFIWLIAAYVRCGRSAGKAIRVFSVTALVSSLLLLAWGLVCEWVLGTTAYPDAAAQMRDVWLMIGGLGVLGSAVLLGIGMIWKQAAEAKASAPKKEVSAAPAPQMEDIPPQEEAASETEAAEEQKAARHFCRFCGEPLVNQDAKFCYKCGKTQEKKD